MLTFPKNDLIDGKKNLVLGLPKSLHTAVVAQVKVLFAGVIVINQKDSLAFVMKLVFSISMSNFIISHLSVIIFAKALFHGCIWAPQFRFLLDMALCFLIHSVYDLSITSML